MYIFILFFTLIIYIPGQQPRGGFDKFYYLYTIYGNKKIGASDMHLDLLPDIFGEMHARIICNSFSKFCELIFHLAVTVFSSYK